MNKRKRVALQKHRIAVKKAKEKAREAKLVEKMPHLAPEKKPKRTRSESPKAPAQA
ncbi:MAG: hypothetical protein M1358_15295 [Chloroflexi bacterium]|nr:hypothetical protein [Chloroflexota bacterium]